MPRTPQFNRETALNNALHLFWRQGYHATSMKDIEEAMDMRPGSIYAAFGNKESLFKEALDTYFAMVEDDFKSTIAKQPSVLQGFRQYLKNIAKADESCAPTRACMLVKTLLEFTPEDKAFSEPVHGYLDSIEAMLTETLTEARSRGELSKQSAPEQLARLIQTNVIGLRTMARRNISQSNLEALVDDVVARIIPVN